MFGCVYLMVRMKCCCFFVFEEAGDTRDEQGVVGGRGRMGLEAGLRAGFERPLKNLLRKVHQDDTTP